MGEATDVLTVDVTDQAPFVPGDHFMSGTSNRPRTEVTRTRYLSGTQTGYRLGVWFSDDFALIINDGLWGTTSPYEAIFRSDGLYILSMRLSGNCVESVNQNTYTLGALTCSMIHYAKNVKHIFRLLPGEPLVEICAIFHLSFFMRKYGLTEQQAERFLNPPKHSNRDPWFNQCPMTHEIEQVIREIQSATPSAKGYRLFAEAKTLEFLSLYLEQLEDNNEGGRRSLISANDLQRLYIAKQCLARHYREPPCIDELCQMVGFNRRKLTESFKSTFGYTIYEYVQYLRMEQAKALFQQGLSDIHRVAEQVGYHHQSSFSKAFKQYAGLSPRQFALSHGKLA